jgi:hypothetical protein
LKVGACLKLGGTIVCLNVHYSRIQKLFITSWVKKNTNKDNLKLFSIEKYYAVSMSATTTTIWKSKC